MTLDEYFDRPDSKPPALVAGEAGISESTLSRIRRAKQNTTRDVMQRIIAATGGLVSAEALVGIHAADPAAAADSPSATNEAEIIAPSTAAPREVANAPFSVTEAATAASSSTCSTTSGQPRQHPDSPSCSTSSEAKAA